MGFFVSFLAVPFAFETSDNKFTFGKSWKPADVSFAGTLESYVIGCNPIGKENFQLWRMLPFAHKTVLENFYIFDKNSQIFTNYLGLEKQPLVYMGSSKQVEATRDPVFDPSEGVLQIGEG